MNEQSPRELEPVALNGVIASVAHLAFHPGAIRQIDPSLRVPREGAGPAGT